MSAVAGLSQRHRSMSLAVVCPPTDDISLWNFYLLGQNLQAVSVKFGAEVLCGMQK